MSIPLSSSAKRPSLLGEAGPLWLESTGAATASAALAAASLRTLPPAPSSSKRS